MGLMNRIDITVIDVTSCKGAVEVLSKGFSIACLVVSNMPNLRGRFTHRVHTTAVGHVTSTR